MNTMPRRERIFPKARRGVRKLYHAGADETMQWSDHRVYQV